MSDSSGIPVSYSASGGKSAKRSRKHLLPGQPHTPKEGFIRDAEHGTDSPGNEKKGYVGKSSSSSSASAFTRLPAEAPPEILM